MTLHNRLEFFNDNSKLLFLSLQLKEFLPGQGQLNCFQDGFLDVAPEGCFVFGVAFEAVGAAGEGREVAVLGVAENGGSVIGDRADWVVG